MIFRLICPSDILSFNQTARNDITRQMYKFAVNILTLRHKNRGIAGQYDAIWKSMARQYKEVNLSVAAQHARPQSAQTQKLTVDSG